MSFRLQLLGTLALSISHLTVAHPASAQLSATEADIVRGVEAKQARTIELLAETVNIPSLERAAKRVAVLMYRLTR